MTSEHAAWSAVGVATLSALSRDAPRAIINVMMKTIQQGWKFKRTASW